MFQTKQSHGGSHRALPYDERDVRRVAVGMSCLQNSTAALERATEVAQACNARMTLILVVPRVSAIEALATIGEVNLPQLVMEQALGRLRDQVDALPQSLSCETVTLVGGFVGELRRFLAKSPYDLLFVGLDHKRLNQSAGLFAEWRLARRSPNGVTVVRCRARMGSARQAEFGLETVS